MNLEPPQAIVLLDLGGDDLGGPKATAAQEAVRGGCWPFDRSRMHSTPMAAAGSHSSIRNRGRLMDSPWLWVRPGRSMISPIEARVVDRPVNRNPVGLVDPAAIPACGADGKGAGDFQPAPLLPRNDPDLFGHLGQVLILAEDQSHIIFATVCHPDDVEGNP